MNEGGKEKTELLNIYLWDGTRDQCILTACLLFAWNCIALVHLHYGKLGSLA